ncbi:ATP-binding protein [Leptospirillum ferriphilum]|uniref:ATP-binding protein n=1 Tax=Leptospirillum ferriphilum TaxID=178606 RepID=UPI000985C1D1|nr:ATP-binding protein [Leptospirillum ferriphilum]OOH80762.1 AAA family ATPase [Leptospirillum ferriphilum]
MKLLSTKDAHINGVKILCYGSSGAGKTRLCATTGGKTVILSAEAGLLSLREHDIPFIQIQGIDDIYQAYDYLANDPEGQTFSWICLDSISEIGEVVLSAGKKSAKDPRAAYGDLQEKMGDLLRAFRDLPGRNVYFSAKQDRIKDEATGIMLYGPSMPGQKLGLQLPYFFDEVFVLRAERSPEGSLVRTLQTFQDVQYTAKDRSGALAPYEDPDLGAIATKISGGQK